MIQRSHGERRLAAASLSSLSLSTFPPTLAGGAGISPKKVARRPTGNFEEKISLVLGRVKDQDLHLFSLRGVIEAALECPVRMRFPIVAKDCLREVLDVATLGVALDENVDDRLAHHDRDRLKGRGRCRGSKLPCVEDFATVQPVGTCTFTTNLHDGHSNSAASN
jgi:hypothetical protein